jgi:ABC-type antimicrobial peptide transport system permease subunit
VTQRKNEIGLRMALGAEAGAVRWMVVAQGARILAIGIAVGLAAAFGLSRVVAGVVVGISPTDPLTFIGVPTILAIVALTANMIPARRATRMDPAATLRAD